MTAPELVFRPMLESDLALVRGWLDEPHVQPWWSPDDYHTDVLPAVVRDEPIEPWILVVNGRDAGYFQMYDIAIDEPYRAACATVGVDAGTAGMDYLLGDAGLIGQGVGSAAIHQFVADIVFGPEALAGRVRRTGSRQPSLDPGAGEERLRARRRDRHRRRAGASDGSPPGRMT